MVKVKFAVLLSVALLSLAGCETKQRAECPAGMKVEDGGNGEGPRKKSKKRDDEG